MAVGPEGHRRYQSLRGARGNLPEVQGWWFLTRVKRWTWLGKHCASIVCRGAHAMALAPDDGLPSPASANACGEEDHVTNGLECLPCFAPLV